MISRIAGWMDRTDPEIRYYLILFSLFSAGGIVLSPGWRVYTFAGFLLLFIGASLLAWTVCEAKELRELKARVKK